MGSHNVCTHWMYQYYVLYLALCWLNEPKHVAEFLILITNICCVYWLNKLLYYWKTQRDGCYQSIHVLPRSVLVIRIYMTFVPRLYFPAWHSSWDTENITSKQSNLSGTLKHPIHIQISMTCCIVFMHLRCFFN